MSEFRTYRRLLPHWRQMGSVYFVTWRLYIGQSALDAEERSTVVAVLQHFERQRYRLWAYVVMDDHVHVVVEIMDNHDLSAITHSWKSFSANQLQKQHGRVGKIWYRECFDRIIRDQKELDEKIRYIMNNPFKRWPDLNDYEWVFPKED